MNTTQNGGPSKLLYKTHERLGFGFKHRRQWPYDLQVRVRITQFTQPWYVRGWLLHYIGLLVKRKRANFNGAVIGVHQAIEYDMGEWTPQLGLFNGVRVCHDEMINTSGREALTYDYITFSTNCGWVGFRSAAAHFCGTGKNGGASLKSSQARSHKHRRSS